MLAENKLNKYLLYAIGEIVLVVIGILIALSINNSNQDRKTRQFEITVLENIQEDILSDRIDLEANLQVQKEVLKNEQRMLDFLLKNQTELLDSIRFTDVLGVDLLIAFHQASFINLQNNDIGLISNNKLHKEITRFYDFFSKAIILLENEHDYTSTYDEKFIYFKKHFNVIDKKSPFLVTTKKSEGNYIQEFERYNFSIRNLKLLKADEAFKVVLSESILINSLKFSFYTQILKKNEELNNSINNELLLLK